METPILRVAVPSPLRRLFDYLPPERPHPALVPGQRVRVPFGRSHVVGLLVEVGADSAVERGRLKRAKEVLDETPLLPADVLALLNWASAYYHHPPGEALSAALPALLRQGEAARSRGVESWRLTPEGQSAGIDALKRAPRQAALLALLQAHPPGLTAEALGAQLSDWRAPMARLAEKGWVARHEGSCLVAPGGEARAGLALNADQEAAVTSVAAQLDGFAAVLLDGVTGSGKTEVYLTLIDQVVARGRQALVLVPEIGLTPQLVQRFRDRFPVPVAVLHSGLSDGERVCAWLAARAGEAPIVIGTRSAVFTPLKRPGLFVVDEEHDLSFKQQDGFRYSARDLIIMRAQRAGVPVLLGSATPSLESLHNVRQGRYRHLHLRQRAGAATPPRMRVLDVRRLPLDEGLSAPLLEAIGRHLAAGNQALLFINRRGYAPTLLCHDCGWVAACQRCDAHMTLHAGDSRLRCHHCGAERRAEHRCPACSGEELRALGQGTERVTEALARHFPAHGIARIDRDTTRRKGAMEALLGEVSAGRSQILVGTQMLAKGHHFPNVTLVGILDADHGLYSADFRAGERMAQLILQVAGRAGRAERPGEVLIQTHHPDHPLLRTLIEQGYPAFADMALTERREALLPPYTYFALLRAEAVDREAPLAFLRQAAAVAEPVAGVSLLGPIPSPMERRAGRFRAQLLIQAEQRAALHRLLGAWAPRLEGMKAGRRVRWSLDVDPMEMF